MFEQQRQNGNGYNNNGFRPSVNTRVLSSYGDESHFVVFAWNENLSVRFSPKTGTDDRGLSIYADFSSPETKKTGISPENAKTLYVAIKNEILPAIDEKVEKSVTIFMGSDPDRKSFTVKTDANGDQYVILATTLDANNMALPNNIITHKFNKKPYVIDYTPETGTGTIEVLVNSEFMGFVDELKNSYLIAMNLHAVRYASVYGSNSNNSIQQNGGYQQRGQMPSMSGNDAPVASFNNAGDFLPFA